MSNPTPGWWRRSGVDLRLVLMCVLLVALAIGFNLMSGGVFLTPENLYNVAQQTAVVGIVSTVMVLIIVCLLYTSPSPRDKRQSRMPSSA